ncbi:hypothetical protein LSPH24S_06597 [Lysinibacillus sphaericus]
MSITIRQAQPQDARAVVPLIIDAIRQISQSFTQGVIRQLQW